MRTSGNNKPPVTTYTNTTGASNNTLHHAHTSTMQYKDNESGSEHQGSEPEVELTLL